MIHATTHCPTTTTSAHLLPSSRFTEETAATHGVYSKQNINNDRADAGVRILWITSMLPVSTDNVDTTLSLAINPDISAVDIRQSPKPSGANTGTINPATTARILFCESAVRLKCRSKLCKNQITIVATKITVNARCKKSFAFSHNNCYTFFNAGIL